MWQPMQRNRSGKADRLLTARGWPRGNLHTSTAPLSMRYTTMRYTSMRHTSMALYFYEEFTQAPDKILRNTLSKKYVNKYF